MFIEPPPIPMIHLGPQTNPNLRRRPGRFHRVVLLEACPPLATAAKENIQRNGAAARWFPARHGDTPIAGWFISWKTPMYKWMMTGGTAISGNLIIHTYIYIYIFMVDRRIPAPVDRCFIYSIIYRVLIIQAGARCLPSTVLCIY